MAGEVGEQHRHILDWERDYSSLHSRDIERIKTAMDYQISMLGISTGELYHSALNSQVQVNLNEGGPMDEPAPLGNVLAAMKPRYGFVVHAADGNVESIASELALRTHHEGLVNEKVHYLLERRFLELTGPDVDMYTHMLMQAAQGMEFMRLQNQILSRDAQPYPDNDALFQPRHFDRTAYDEMMIASLLHDVGEPVTGDNPDPQKTVTSEIAEQRATEEVLAQILPQMLPDEHSQLQVRDIVMAHAFGEENQSYRWDRTELFRVFEMIGYIETCAKMAHLDEQSHQRLFTHTESWPGEREAFERLVVMHGKSMLEKNIAKLRQEASDREGSPLRPYLAQRYPAIEPAIQEALHRFS